MIWIQHTGHVQQNPLPVELQTAVSIDQFKEGTSTVLYCASELSWKGIITLSARMRSIIRKQHSICTRLSTICLRVWMPTREVVGGGNSANCVAVRSLKYGHLVVVKAFHEATEKVLSDNEAKVYEHLSHLQGIYISFVFAKASAIFV